MRASSCVAQLSEALPVHVKELWRYPAKSMAGERMERAQVGDLGITGDRKVLVVGTNGRIITSRTRHKLLGLKATIGAHGGVLINGGAWDAPKTLSQVQDAAGPDARLIYFEGPERFDILPLLVATDGAIQAFGHDGRRLRPNIVVGGVEGLSERSWPGKRLRMGDVLIGVQDLRGRCVMTTYDPDTLKQDQGVLKEIIRKFDGKLALNCYVISGGEIRVGDKVELLSGEEAPVSG